MDSKRVNPEKKFLKKPLYPGGKKALLAFISAHLQYPQDALEQQLEGIVSVAFDVTDNGEVESIKIIKGLSPSCNEEAIRLVKLLQFNKVSNHGIRIKTGHKINIAFKISSQSIKNLKITYNLQVDKPKDKPSIPPSYSYTIKF